MRRLVAASISTLVMLLPFAYSGVVTGLEPGTFAAPEGYRRQDPFRRRQSLGGAV